MSLEESKIVIAGQSCFMSRYISVKCHSTLERDILALIENQSSFLTKIQSSRYLYLYGLGQISPPFVKKSIKFNTRNYLIS